MNVPETLVLQGANYDVSLVAPGVYRPRRDGRCGPLCEFATVAALVALTGNFSLATSFAGIAGDSLPEVREASGMLAEDGQRRGVECAPATALNVAGGVS